MNMRHLRSKTLTVAAATALLFSAHSVSAATRTWLLDGVSMSGGTSLDGTFSTDSATGNLTAYHIEVEGGPDNGYLYSNTIPQDSVIANGPQDYELANGGSILSWAVDQSLASGATQANVLSSAFDCQACGNAFSGTTGSVVALPEPSAWLMLLLGIGGIGAAIRSARRGQAALAAS